MDDVPVNSPVDSLTLHNTDRQSTVSNSRDLVESIQVNNDLKPLQCKRLKDYGEDKVIQRHNDSSDSLVDAVPATCTVDSLSEMCIGYSAPNRLSVQPQKSSDSLHSPVTECCDDKEYLEFTTSVPDSDNELNSTDVPKPSVFIIYSDDDNPDNHILDFSNMLTEFGFDCEVDQYHGSDPRIYNWGNWIEDMIKKVSQENGSVLYMCSPTLHKACISMKSLQIEMKCGHINNQSLHGLIIDPSISFCVIPVFLEQYKRGYIPSCLLRTHAYALNFSSTVLKVFTPEAMIAVRERDTDTLNTLLNTPGLQSFRSLLYRLKGEKEAAKPSVSVDFATLPRLTSINSHQMEHLQRIQHQAESMRASFATCTASQVQYQPCSDSAHNSYPSFQQYGCQSQDLDQWQITVNPLFTSSPYSVSPVQAEAEHLPSFLSAVKKNFKQLMSTFCHNSTLYQLFVALFFIVIIIIFYFFTFYV